jgi:hypothetical protein
MTEGACRTQLQALVLSSKRPTQTHSDAVIVYNNTTAHGYSYSFSRFSFFTFHLSHHSTSTYTLIMIIRHSTYILLSLSTLIPTINAFSFSFTDSPNQCSNVTVEWDGGQAPFTLLLVPTGHVNPETRTIIQQDVSSGDSVSFVLDFPADSQFVAVLSDATGIGSGGACLVHHL